MSRPIRRSFFAVVTSMAPISAMAAMAAMASIATGCVASPRVVRVYDGRIVEGRFIAPDAYAAFLRGVLAEESGDLKAAITAYAQAADEDEEDPELFTRIGEARCKLDPKDAEADKAFARASKLDATYASTLAARSRCASARGLPDQAADLARQAAAQDPKSVALGALAIRTSTGKNDPAAREHAIALTLAHGQYPAAWDALVAWGRAHRDAELVARGLEGLVHAAPMRTAEVEKGAVLLMEGGQLALARRVASTVADAPRELGVRGPRDATVARLAVDEALARGERNIALARATRGHVPLAEVAARALVLDKKDIAAAMATKLVEADPGASGAQMVRLALKSGAGAGPAGKPGAKGAGGADSFARVTDQPPEICALVFADRLAAAAGVDVARTWLSRITRTPMALHDPLVGPLAVDLATRGVLPTADLPADLRASLERPLAAE